MSTTLYAINQRVFIQGRINLLHTNLCLYTNSKIRAQPLITVTTKFKDKNEKKIIIILTVYYQLVVSKYNRCVL